MAEPGDITPFEQLVLDRHLIVMSGQKRILAEIRRMEMRLIELETDIDPFAAENEERAKHALDREKEAVAK